jgi:hypothetical protein
LDEVSNTYPALVAMWGSLFKSCSVNTNNVNHGDTEAQTRAIIRF